MSRLLCALVATSGCDDGARGPGAPTASPVETHVTTAHAPRGRPSSIATPAPSTRSRCEDLTSGAGVSQLPFDPSRAPFGVDASTPAPWKSLRDQGVRFGFVNATQGTHTNKSFRANWKSMRQCKMIRGAYHFFDPRRDAKPQAELFLDLLGDDVGEIAPVIDVEQPPACKKRCCDKPCDYQSALIKQWIDTVEAATKRKVMVYAVEDYWKECLCNTSRFADQPLWLPAYPAFDFRVRPGFGGWQRWEYYQYRGNIRFAGSVVDLNTFRHAAEKLPSPPE